MRLYGVTGRKNQGKTTLVERLVAHFSARGLRVSTVKHTHHGVDLEVPGTDTHRHRQAGAGEVVLASDARLAFLHELRGEAWDLPRILAAMQPADLVLVEGYKSAPHRKIEVWRGASEPPLAQQNPTIRALAGDGSAAPAGLPVFGADDVAAIAAFILRDAGE
ncbi:molybdopterin-guanine dinucleotide biosynthesis protein B [Rhodobacteraceae bacterium 2CG4]|uniref:Molybdopterin-guanine dinucleotide biosynthesis protein B n=1 Tax=Halovulum marinum TaxID=2662447 RepID=A0A6L5YVB2_9RHOB|nr:molybdopterin-guanine dinucleotide biosynthesis protein B [Halovulum marinum]MSU88198.1 molybdopterin-guanine dinucleotide biosynthesis protein B [Halovulum marinum]